GVGMMGSAIAYPIMKAGQVLGVVAFEAKSVYALDYRDSSLLHLLSGYLCSHWELFRRITEIRVPPFGEIPAQPNDNADSDLETLSRRVERARTSLVAQQNPGA